MTLNDCNKCKNIKVKNITGGLLSTKRLSDMGILPGEIIELIKNDKKGPIIIKLKGTSIALGRGIALKIEVEHNEKL